MAQHAVRHASVRHACVTVAAPETSLVKWLHVADAENDHHASDRSVGPAGAGRQSTECYCPAMDVWERQHVPSL